MRIALVTPVAYPSVGGNAVTVGRLREGLQARGITADVVDLSRPAGEPVDERLATLAPDLVHAFHAFRGAPAAVGFTRRRGTPLVVSLTGTDVNIDLFHPERRATTIASIRAATGLVAFHESIGVRVAREVPEAARRIEVIPQGVSFGAQPAAAEPASRAPGEVRFLLPAGIRRVKNVLFPLAPLGDLARRFPIRLSIAGPVIEADEGRRLTAALAGNEWAAYLGVVAHGRMASLLDQVDVVLNCSLSEGGMANSVLEAMARGRAVLASDIEGNRSVIEEDVDGLLYRGVADFSRQAARLIQEPALRQRLGAAAGAKVRRLYPPEREIDRHVALYRRLLAG
jgi:glycosyltransferase involved in cell wall biosynthesis